MGDYGRLRLGNIHPLQPISDRLIMARIDKPLFLQYAGSHLIKIVRLLSLKTHNSDTSHAKTPFSLLLLLFSFHSTTFPTTLFQSLSHFYFQTTLSFLSFKHLPRFLLLHNSSLTFYSQF